MRRSSTLIGLRLPPFGEGIRERARESPLANRLAVYAEAFEAALHPVFAEAVAETLNLLTIQPESHERVPLPYTVANPRPRPDLEARMLELVNQERKSGGLKPLAPDPESRRLRGNIQQTCLSAATLRTTRRKVATHSLACVKQMFIL